MNNQWAFWTEHVGNTLSKWPLTCVSLLNEYHSKWYQHSIPASCERILDSSLSWTVPLQSLMIIYLLSSFQIYPFFPCNTTVTLYYAHSWLDPAKASWALCLQSFNGQDSIWLPSLCYLPFSQGVCTPLHSHGCRSQHPFISLHLCTFTSLCLEQPFLSCLTQQSSLMVNMLVVFLGRCGRPHLHTFITLCSLYHCTEPLQL